MKYQILLLALIVTAVISCTTAYKTGQTPDDVYFSPARPANTDEYVQVEKKDDRRYQSPDEYYDDRSLRMRVQNRYRWSALDDYYFTNPYAYNYYGYSNNWNNPWSDYWTWNNYYNPYCHQGVGFIIRNPAVYTPPPSKPIAFNPASYVGNTNINLPAGMKGVSSGYYNNSRNYNNGGTRYNNSNSNSRSSKSYSNQNNNDSYTPSSSTPSRSYNPSSSSSSSGSSSSSSSGSKSGGSSGSSSGSSRPPR